MTCAPAAIARGLRATQVFEFCGCKSEIDAGTENALSMRRLAAGRKPKKKNSGVLVGVAALLLLGVAGAAAARARDAGPAAATLQPVPELDAAFHMMYELRFAEARGRIAAWQKDHPDDPFGHAALAATYLFEEFYRQGVFTSAFFLDDKKFLGGIDGRPDEERRRRFLDAIHRAQDLAARRLAANPRDTEALLAHTISSGMLCDYTSLIEKRHWPALKFVREAEDYSKRLLAVEPGMLDAYVALGTANYIIGSLPGYKQFFLSIGGIRGDRARGMSQLQQAVTGGHYLQPFAKIMLALVSLREKDPGRARLLLQDLARDFPTNPVFQKELDLLTPEISH